MTVGSLLCLVVGFLLGIAVDALFLAPLDRSE